uniref:Ovule protein n=1 Tax=Caenorhabditis tropicalis TaxID=1561998 RepID=A0A1I7TIX1_9PELO
MGGKGNLTNLIEAEINWIPRQLKIIPLHCQPHIRLQNLILLVHVNQQNHRDTKVHHHRRTAHIPNWPNQEVVLSKKIYDQAIFVLSHGFALL